MYNYHELVQWNESLGAGTPADTVKWAIEKSGGRAVVSTNFGPYEAALLHLCVRVQPDIPVLWVDHGFNRPATYRHAQELREKLGLNLKCFVPQLTSAHWDALHGPVPTLHDEYGLAQFSLKMKLEPFQRAMRELAPLVWITGLRKVQNPSRANLDIVSPDPNFNTIKVSPFFYWSDADLESYLKKHGLPNEWDYFDPAKGDQKRECGLHASWAAKALAAA